MARFSLAVLAVALGSVNAFAPKQIRSPVSTAIRVQANESPPTVTTIEERNSYAEVSRSYRRTVFTHDDWVRHRSSDRFLRNLGNLFNSGVYKNIMREVSVVTGLAALVVVANLLLCGYTDFDGVHQAGLLEDLHMKLSLPLTPFTLASPSLGLLLGKCDDNTCDHAFGRNRRCSRHAPFLMHRFPCILI